MEELESSDVQSGSRLHWLRRRLVKCEASLTVESDSVTQGAIDKRLSVESRMGHCITSNSIDLNRLLSATDEGGGREGASVSVRGIVKRPPKRYGSRWKRHLCRLSRMDNQAIPSFYRIISDSNIGPGPIWELRSGATFSLVSLSNEIISG